MRITAIFCLPLVFSLERILVSAAHNYNYVSHPKQNVEFGSYMNPNPRAPCEGEELQRLNTCANDILAKLDDCKADDLACECCALQSLSRDCYGLCPGSPSGSFLSVLYDDCNSLNDVNACGLPFKKLDGGASYKGMAAAEATKGLHKSGRNRNNKNPDVVLKSKFGSSAVSTLNTTNSTVNITSEVISNIVAIKNATKNVTLPEEAESPHHDEEEKEEDEEEVEDEEQEKEEHHKKHGKKRGKLHKIKNKLKSKKLKLKSEGSKAMVKAKTLIFSVTTLLITFLL